MRRAHIIFFLFLIISTPIFAEGEAEAGQKENQFSLKFSGYIKNDFFYDTRQSVTAREGQFYFWPSPVLPDANGNDLNAKSSFNFLAIQSRMRLKISGPEVLGAKPSGMIECDFVGQANDNIGLVRLRHAFVKLNWENTELLTGQYWNPLFITDCYPTTVSFNAGVPIQGLARNPQIRVTHTIGGLKLIAAAVSQRDFASMGPDGKSSSYLRNSILPELHAQVQYAFPNVLFGASIAHKTITPRLASEVDGEKYEVDESISGISALGFVKITTKPLTIKFQGRYGENNTDLLTMSGYAVKAIINQETQERSYTPLTNTSFWGDIQTNGDKLQFGLFAGMVTNHGTKESMDETLADDPIIYGFGQDIESLYRFSPRVVYNLNKIRFGLETELTVANYGKDHDLNWQALTTERVENCRVLMSVYYFF